MGLKYQMLDLVQVDIKEQMLTYPTPAAFDIGVSGAWTGGSEDGDIEGVLAVYPSFILDSGTWPFGVKDIIIYSRIGIDFVEDNLNPSLTISHMPGWFVGKTIPFRGLDCFIEVSAYSPVDEMNSGDYNYLKKTIFT